VGQHAPKNSKHSRRLLIEPLKCRSWHFFKIFQKVSIRGRHLFKTAGISPSGLIANGCGLERATTGFSLAICSLTADRKSRGVLLTTLVSGEFLKRIKIMGFDFFLVPPMW